MTISNPLNAFNLQNNTKQSITRSCADQALVVIDSKIENYQSLVTGVKPNSDVIIIYPEDDAIAKISQQIADNLKISSIHLVSHGSPGCLYLGNGELSLNTLSDYAQALTKWKARESLDILIYGCNVGAGDAGEEFVHKLREITQANIAVSANKTGNKELGGDWSLELRLGNIESTLALNNEVRESYGGVFAEAVLAAEIYPGEGFYHSSSPKDLTVFNGELYFSANDGDIASDGIYGRELWKYNPSDGASLVADINPSTDAVRDDSLPSNLTVFNDELYFSADDGIHGRELWKYNPTDGASLVADIQPGDRTSSPSYLTVFNGELYFSPHYEIYRNEVPHELWKYNPTEGASLVVDLSPDDLTVNEPSYLTVFNDELYFAADGGHNHPEAFGTSNNQELWKYNPTDGASLVADINPGASRPKNLTVFNDELYFVASYYSAEDNSTGIELWKYNPTDGISLLTEPGGYQYDNNGPLYLTAFNGNLYFSDVDGDIGRELWKYNPTDGISLAANINADSEDYHSGSYPQYLAVFNDDLYFSADDGIHGQELFFLQGNDSPVAVDDEISRGSTVYRFFNSSAGVHFYTPSEIEKDYVDNNLENYTYEGESYVTVDHLTGNSAQAVYRFFNSTTGVHLYTTDEGERDYIIENLSNFAYEDITFYAYETEQIGTVPIHRFYEPTIGVHFYTPNEGEKIFVEENLLNYNYEGIAFYAYPINDTGSI